jgi:PAS domain-containing protein
VKSVRGCAHSNGAARQGLDAGADDYLIKPFSARQLLARVGALIELEHMRRSAEQAFRLRTSQYETLLMAAPLGVYLVDADFRVREVNPRARAVFGDIPDLIGRDFDEVIHILWPKAYADEIVRRFRHTLETGVPYVRTRRAPARPASTITSPSLRIFAPFRKRSPSRPRRRRADGHRTNPGSGTRGGTRSPQHNRAGSRGHTEAR